MKEIHLSALCIIVATVLAVLGIKGWEWLVFVALMLAV